jgi:hypothetical protein
MEETTMATTTRYRKGTFQMLWDCPQCGRRKNLGVDHRHCPGCGQVQEENLRYYPRPGERVPTKFMGRSPDVECDHCGTPNSSADNNCINCGAGLAGTKQVHVRPSIPEHQGETGEDAQRDWDARKARERAARIAYQQPSAQKTREQPRARRVEPAPTSYDLEDFNVSRFQFDRRHAVAGVILAIFTFAMTCVLWKKDVVVEVQGHTWERRVAVERYASYHDEEWCSSMPSDAYSVSRSSEVHHHDRVPDGEECHTEAGSCTETCRNVDNGNGSFSVDCTKSCTPDRQVCNTKYRDEPVYRDKCSYTVDRWRTNRHATASGSGTSPAPSWPESTFKQCSDTRIGCERLGGRDATYTVHFVAPSEDKEFECEYDQNRWQGYEPGSRWSARVGIGWARLDCDSMKSPERGAGGAAL